jgi:hypothetical protein
MEQSYTIQSRHRHVGEDEVRRTGTSSIECCLTVYDVCDQELLTEHLRHILP